ncbi:MAG: helix-turn-helix domain-containing protein [Ktedonobacteraceae bacterium]|nr:helix-turn-helix domain-containing protein [Ktedonobacteraceae bacterium]
MVKVANAPRNFYTASQAIKKLGMPRNTFFNYVRSGKIKKVVPPGQKEGYYLKADIDKLAQARELFTLEYAADTDTSTFERATEEDMRAIYELCVHLWGVMGTPSYEARLGEYKANPYTYYVVKQDGIVVGFLSLTPFKEESLKAFMGETYEHVIEGPGSIEPFVSGKPIESLFLDIGVRRGLRKGTKYGMRLIQGGIEVLEDFAKQGNIVKKLVATSSVPDGINLCKGLGFKELPLLPGSARHRFELDLETSNLPHLKKYQGIVKKTKSKKTSNNQVDNKIH